MTLPVCPSCGADVSAPGPAGRATVGWQPCNCQGGRGHRTQTCLACETTTYDPPCLDPGRDVSGMGQTHESAPPRSLGGDHDGAEGWRA